MDDFKELLVDDELMLAGLAESDISRSVVKTARRRTFKTNMKFPLPVTIMRVNQGGGKPELVWVCKRPHFDKQTSAMDTAYAQMMTVRINAQIPHYASQAVMKQHKAMLRGLGLTSAGAFEYVCRNMLHDDRALHHTSRDAELDERVAMFIASGFDPQMAADLRHHNSSEEKYAEFLELFDDAVKQMQRACHERRHGRDYEVEHVTTSFSIPDLIGHVIKLYNERNPEEADSDEISLAVPCVDWVNYALCPSAFVPQRQGVQVCGADER